MEETLKKQLEEIEQRGNYLEMNNALRLNMGLALTDADYSIFVLKCILHGGMADGENDMVSRALNGSRENENDSMLINRVLAKKTNDVIDIGRKNVLVLTNSNFILAIKTIITYGKSETIDEAAKLICPLYGPVGEMLKHKGTINFKTYNLVAALMCVLGNTIADSVIQTNKAAFSGSKNIISGFKESIMVPLKSYISGFNGLLVGNGVPRNIRNQVKETYNKMAKMA